MKHFIRIIFSGIILLFFQTDLRAEQDSQHITVTIPETVIQRGLEQALPLTLNTTSTQAEGEITVEKVMNLHFHDNGLSALITLYGKDLSLKTMVADQTVRLQLGEARADFDCEVGLRHDASRQILYLIPRPREVNSEHAPDTGDIGEVLLLLLNGREFPVALDNLEPIIAQAGDKTITIENRITGITTRPGMLELRLVPEVGTLPGNI